MFILILHAISKQIVHAISVRRVLRTLVYSSVTVIQLFIHFHFAANRGRVNVLLARSLTSFDLWVHSFTYQFVCLFTCSLTCLSIRSIMFVPLFVDPFVSRFGLYTLCSVLFVIHAVNHSSLSCTPYISKSFTRSRFTVSHVFHILYWVHSLNCFLIPILRRGGIARNIWLFVRSHHLVYLCWCICLRVSSSIRLLARLLACPLV